MELLIIIGLSALAASLLTFFSGFGLGTLLTPVFAIFFPIEIAIALTAIVHFLNNLFKLGLTYKNINWDIALRFGAFSFIGSAIGALVLVYLPANVVIHTYNLGTYTYHVLLLKLIVGLVMLFFALYEFIPALSNQKLSNKLWFGGLLSGFFGGLTGNQGALRSAFLAKATISKEVFIATGIIIACFVDVARLGVYNKSVAVLNFSETGLLLLVAIIAAFAGAYLGSKLLKKTSFTLVKNGTFIFISLIALALIAGLI